MDSEQEMRLAEEFLGDGLYKLGYVTRNLDLAMDRARDLFGIEEFVPFEPDFHGRTADGRSGRGRLGCAFSAGRHHTIELLQPIEGLVDLWADPLADAAPTDLVFHHVGLVSHEIAGLRAAAIERGHRVEFEAERPGRYHFLYLKAPGVSHFTEHIQYFGDADTFLRSVQSREVK